MLTCSVDQESLQTGVTIISSDYEVATDKEMQNLVAHSYGEAGNEYSVIFDYELERGRDYYGRIRCILSTGPIDWGEPTKLTYDDDTINFNMAIPSAINAPILDTLFWREEHPHTNFTIFGGEFVASGNTKHTKSIWTITDVSTGQAILTRTTTVELNKLYVDIVLDYNKVYRIDCIYGSDNDGYSPRGGLVIATTCPLVRDGTPTMMAENTDMIVYKNGIGRPNALHEWFLYDEDKKVTQTYIPGVPEVVAELDYTGIDTSILNPVIISDEKFDAIQLGSENNYVLRVTFSNEMEGVQNDLIFQTSDETGKVRLLIANNGVIYNTTDKYNFSTQIVDGIILATYEGIATTDELVPDVPIVYTSPNDIGATDMIISDAKFAELKSSLDAGKPIIVYFDNDLGVVATNINLNTNTGNSIVLAVGGSGIDFTNAGYYVFTGLSSVGNIETVEFNTTIPLDVNLIFNRSMDELGFTDTVITDYEFDTTYAFATAYNYLRMVMVNGSTSSQGTATITNTTGDKSITLSFEDATEVLTAGTIYRFDVIEITTTSISVLYESPATIVQPVSGTELTYDGSRVSRVQDELVTTEFVDATGITLVDKAGYLKIKYNDTLADTDNYVLKEDAATSRILNIDVTGTKDTNIFYSYSGTVVNDVLELSETPIPNEFNIELTYWEDLSRFFTNYVLTDLEYDDLVAGISLGLSRIGFSTNITLGVGSVFTIINTTGDKSFDITNNHSSRIESNDLLVISEPTTGVYETNYVVRPYSQNILNHNAEIANDYDDFNGSISEALFDLWIGEFTDGTIRYIELEFVNAISSFAVGNVRTHTELSTSPTNKIVNIPILTDVYAGEKRWFTITSGDTTANDERLEEITLVESSVGGAPTETIIDVDFDILPAQATLVPAKTSYIYGLGGSTADEIMSSILYQVGTGNQVLLKSGEAVTDRMCAILESADGGVTDQLMVTNDKTTTIDDTIRIELNTKIFMPMDGTLPETFAEVETNGTGYYKSYFASPVPLVDLGPQPISLYGVVEPVEIKILTTLTADLTAEVYMEYNSTYSTSSQHEVDMVGYVPTQFITYVDVGDGLDNITLPTGLWQSLKDAYDLGQTVSVKFENDITADNGRIINFVDPDDATLTFVIDVLTTNTGTSLGETVYDLILTGTELKTSNPVFVYDAFVATTPGAKVVATKETTVVPTYDNSVTPNVLTIPTLDDTTIPILFMDGIVTADEDTVIQNADGTYSKTITSDLNAGSVRMEYSTCYRLVYDSTTDTFVIKTLIYDWTGDNDENKIIQYAPEELLPIVDTQLVPSSVFDKIVSDQDNGQEDHIRLTFLQNIESSKVYDLYLKEDVAVDPRVIAFNTTDLDMDMEAGDINLHLITYLSKTLSWVLAPTIGLVEGLATKTSTSHVVSNRLVPTLLTTAEFDAYVLEMESYKHPYMTIRTQWDIDYLQYPTVSFVEPGGREIAFLLTETIIGAQNYAFDIVYLNDDNNYELSVQTSALDTRVVYQDIVEVTHALTMTDAEWLNLKDMINSFTSDLPSHLFLNLPKTFKPVTRYLTLHNTGDTMAYEAIAVYVEYAGNDIAGKYIYHPYTTSSGETFDFVEDLDMPPAPTIDTFIANVTREFVMTDLVVDQPTFDAVIADAGAGNRIRTYFTNEQQNETLPVKIQGPDEFINMYLDFGDRLMAGTKHDFVLTAGNLMYLGQAEDFIDTNYDGSYSDTLANELLTDTEVTDLQTGLTTSTNVIVYFNNAISGLNTVGFENTDRTVTFSADITGITILAGSYHEFSLGGTSDSLTGTYMGIGVKSNSVIYLGTNKEFLDPTNITQAKYDEISPLQEGKKLLVTFSDTFQPLAQDMYFAIDPNNVIRLKISGLNLSIVSGSTHEFILSEGTDMVEGNYLGISNGVAGIDEMAYTGINVRDLDDEVISTVKYDEVIALLNQDKQVRVTFTNTIVTPRDDIRFVDTTTDKSITLTVANEGRTFVGGHEYDFEINSVITDNVNLEYDDEYVELVDGSLANNEELTATTSFRIKQSYLDRGRSYLLQGRIVDDENPEARYCYFAFRTSGDTEFGLPNTFPYPLGYGQSADGQIDLKFSRE